MIVSKNKLYPKHLTHTLMSKKEKVIDILFESFYKNGSVNFVVKQDNKKDKRIKTLLEYSYYKGTNFGKIYLSKNEAAAAITIDPNKEKFTFWELKLIFKVIGLKGLAKVLKREGNLKKRIPNKDFIYLWYVGVREKNQGNGFGTELIQQIISDNPNKAIHLQTSASRNFALYEKLGFQYDGDYSQPGYYVKIYTYSKHLEKQ